MAAQPRFSILFVLGRSHTGTTLLGRMLNMHDHVLCAGEMLRLDSALFNPGELCSCGTLLRDCPFWNRWINKLPNPLKTNYANWTFEILDEIRSREGKRLLVDLSKTRAFRVSHRWRTPAVGYLLMVRDPRGTLRSDLGRGKSLFTELRLHRKWLRRYLAFTNRNARNCFTVFYEDLISSAECQLRRICQFLGLDYSPQMLAPDAKVHHFVRSSLSGFLKGAHRFQVDERWRSDLTPEQIKTIDKKLSSFAIYGERYQLARTAPSPAPVLPTATAE